MVYIFFSTVVQLWRLSLGLGTSCAETACSPCVCGFLLGTLTSSHCPKNRRWSGSPFFFWWLLHWPSNPKTANPTILSAAETSRENNVITWISGLTQSSDYQCLHTQSKSFQVWLYGPEGRSQNKAVKNCLNKHVSLLLDRRHQPEQHDVSRRAPTRWNERAHDGQGHVELKDVVAVVFPGTLAQRGGHVYARQHHLFDAGAIMKHLMRQRWQYTFGSAVVLEKLSVSLVLELCFFVVVFGNLTLVIWDTCQ